MSNRHVFMLTSNIPFVKHQEEFTKLWSIWDVITISDTVEIILQKDVNITQYKNDRIKEFAVVTARKLYLTYNYCNKEDSRL